MKLLWNDEEYYKIQKSFPSNKDLLLLIKVSLIGKLEYSELFKIYDMVVNNSIYKSFFFEKHTKEETYNFLKGLEV